MLAFPAFLSSCIYDKFDAEEPAPSGESAFFSVSFAFADDVSSGTRAELDGGNNTQDGDYFFNQGILEESAISTDREVNWLMAYKQGELIGAFPIISVKHIGNNATGNLYSGVCEVTGEKKEDIEGIDNMEIVLNVNASLSDHFKNLKTEGSVEEIMQTESGNNGYLFHTSDGMRYHTMSSSMIVNNGRAVPVTMIDPGGVKIYPSMYEARENPSATLYVERLQSKFTVLFQPSAESNDQYFCDGEVFNYTEGSPGKAGANVIVFRPTPPSGSNETENSEPLTTQVYYVSEFKISDIIPTVKLGNWKASVVGWGINGTEKSSYLFKKLSSSEFGRNFTPNGLSYPVRNMWAIDSHYDNAGDYPDQFRISYDGSVNSYDGKEENYGLNYLSFKSLSNRAIRQYTAENTFDATAVFGSNSPTHRAQYRVGNTLLIGTQLLIKGFDEANVYNPSKVDKDGLIVDESGNRVKTKYFMDNIFWSEDAYKNYFCKYLATNLNSIVPCKSNLTAGKEFVPNDIFTPAKDEYRFYVKDGDKMRLADNRDFEIGPLYITGGDGWCIPYPKLDKNDKTKTKTCLYVCTEVGDETNTYRQITLAEFEKFAYGYSVYFAKCYNQGRMYYAQPIGVGTTFGTVRNHWYHYHFSQLKNIGIPVHDPDQPIIPTPEPSQVGFGFEVQIIPWHIVEEEVNI